MEEAGAVNNANEQQPQGFNFAGLARTLMIYYFISTFFRGDKPAVDPSSGQPLPPHHNIWRDTEPFSIDVYLSKKDFIDLEALHRKDKLDDVLFWHQDHIKYNWDPSNERSENVTIPTWALNHLINNGSLFAHIYVTKQGYAHLPSDPDYDPLAVFNITQQLNSHRPKRKTQSRVNLVSGEVEEVEIQGRDMYTDEIVNYWKPTLSIRMLHDFTVYPSHQIPPDVAPYYSFPAVQNFSDYFPVTFVDDFWLLSDDFIMINETVQSLTTQAAFSPISQIKWRLQLQMDVSWKMQRQLGSDSGDTDTFKRMVLETNPTLLALTMVVSTLHMVFEFLAFKNDIQFWKNKEHGEGLSARTMLVNCVFQVIIFLYLLDNDTSWMILISSAIGLAIEIWKIRKTLNVNVVRQPSFPFVTLKVRNKHAPTEEEQASRTLTEHEKSMLETQKYDEEAMRYTSYGLYPLVLGLCIYSLIYDSHKSWYSFILSSLTSCVYTFGFVMMVPQLYMNYKLKSVAHLPWRMLTYKALNTFIDDLFAFIIKMPTLHRLSCFRDDIIFFIYIYQRYLYRVDYSRANEYGLVAKTPEEVQKDKEEDERKQLEETKQAEQSNQAETAKTESEESKAETEEASHSAEEAEKSLHETDLQESVKQRKPKSSS